MNLNEPPQRTTRSVRIQRDAHGRIRRVADRYLVSMGTAVELMAEAWALLDDQQREQVRLTLAQRRAARRSQPQPKPSPARVRPPLRLTHDCGT